MWACLLYRKPMKSKILKLNHNTVWSRHCTKISNSRILIHTFVNFVFGGQWRWVVICKCVRNRKYIRTRSFHGEIIFKFIYFIRYMRTSTYCTRTYWKKIKTPSLRCITVQQNHLTHF